MSVSVSRTLDVYHGKCRWVLSMSLGVFRSVSRYICDVTTSPGLVRRDCTVSRCVARVVSLALRVCMCVCKSVSVFIHECYSVWMTALVFVWLDVCMHQCLWVSCMSKGVFQSVSTSICDVTTRPSLVGGDCTGFHRGCTLSGHHFCTPWAHGGILRGTFLASSWLVGFHPVFAFISQIKMHFEV